VIRRYDIEHLFAEGAQSRVYKARDRLTQQCCLLKTGSTVQQEALLTLQLNHPYIAQAFDCGLHPEIGQYAAYPLITDPPLVEWIKGSRRPEEIHRVAAQIAEFLAFIHARRLLYNDFKPEHFLIGNTEIKVIDLGLCELFTGSNRAATFSGTFPYISPERLAGRNYDHRSDLFALGMLLRRMFFPDEQWNMEPSVSALHTIATECQPRERFWRDLISKMTVFEPSQRIESALELWEAVLPARASGTTLFLPCTGHFSIPPDIISGPLFTLVHSASRMNLQEAANQTLQEAWKLNLPIFEIDLQAETSEQWLSRLHSVFLEEPFQDFYSTMLALQKLRNQNDSILLLHAPESPGAEERRILTYILYGLSHCSWLRTILLSIEKNLAVPDECRAVEIPLMDKNARDRLLSQIFPPQFAASDKIEKLRNKHHTLPEQLFTELRSGLPPEAFAFWPAIARSIPLRTPLERVGTLEMRVLGCLAVAGGSLAKPVLITSLHLNAEQADTLVERLGRQGHIQEKSGNLILTLSPSTVLSRLTTARVKDIARALLSSGTDTFDGYVHYHLARIARQNRLAAKIALKAARALRQANGTESSEWLLHAFNSGARLPQTQLHRLFRFCLRRSRRREAQRLLKQLRKRFGLSYRLADCFLEYYGRTNNFKSAEHHAREMLQMAAARKHTNAQAHFSVLLAGLLLQLQRLDEAQKYLHDLPVKTQGANIQGMKHHYQGLAYFHQGELHNALLEFRKSVRIRHPLRHQSVLSIGVALGILGRNQKAEKWIRRAIDIETRRQDLERLSAAFNNLGLLYKKTGEIQNAREKFLRCIELSLASKNKGILAVAYSNLASTYEMEGRTDRAIYYYRKASSAGKRSPVVAHRALPIANIGLQYAYQGKYRRAITALREAAGLFKEARRNVELAGCYEFLGLTYQFSRHFSQAEYFLRLSGKLYSESRMQQCEARTLLYLSLVAAEKGKIPESTAILNQVAYPLHQTFEEGLYHYVRAFQLLRSKDSKIDGCRESIQEAERFFRKAPSLFWLARAFKLKAEYCLKTEHYEKASIVLQSAYNIFARLGAAKELLSLSRGYSGIKMPEDFIDRMAEKLPYKVLLMIKDVLTEQDPDVMISRILSCALEFTDMERAVLMLSEDPPRIFRSMTLEESTEQEIYEISRSALEAATQGGKPYISLDAATDPYLRDKRSILASRIQSIVCLPLRARKQLLGVLYLDSREGVETLAKTESVLLEIFASIIGLALNKTLVLERSLAENKELRSSLGLLQFPEIIASSESMLQVLKTVHRLLDSELPALITGETGTGKELIARVLHFSSSSKRGSFVAVNCSALSKSLLESELFGHEKGAFTGASNLKKGLFEQARHGTLFLDEIGEMPYSMQAKLLRVLQEGEFRRVGGNETLHTDARIILATNRNLGELVRRQQFREDLYYRIRGVQIHLPPLRERRADIPLLAAHFLKSAVVASRKKILGFSPEALDLLKHYSWPGNVRQLKHEIERIVALTESDWIQSEELDPEIQTAPPVKETKQATLREKEKQIILDTLSETRWNIVQTARILGLTRNGLYGKMRIHGISRKSVK
jgi:transcriptional regulator with GAF, ATPase, and Fis domain/serine/threonine protein kinase/Flp pilus assembly protein TadD